MFSSSATNVKAKDIGHGVFEKNVAGINQPKIEIGDLATGIYTVRLLNGSNSIIELLFTAH